SAAHPLHGGGGARLARGDRQVDPAPRPDRQASTGAAAQAAGHGGDDGDLGRRRGGGCLGAHGGAVGHERLRIRSEAQDPPQELPGTDRVVEPRGEAAKQLGGPEYEQYLEDTLKRRQAHPEESQKLDPEALRNLPGICIGKEMSHQLRAWVGDVVNVLTPLGEMTPTGPVPRSRPFRVACILYSGMYEYDSKFVYIGIPEAQRFFKM